jgi:hypothetical protein
MYYFLYSTFQHQNEVYGVESYIILVLYTFCCCNSSWFYSFKCYKLDSSSAFLDEKMRKMNI